MNLENREHMLPRLSERLPITICTLNHLRDTGFQFPQNPKNKHILDIGAGLTTVPKELRKKGAVIYALDIKYREINSLQEVSAAAINEMRALLTKNQPPSIQFKVLQNIKNTEKAALEDMQTHPDSFIYGSMYDIPFADETFDFVYSSMCIDRAGSNKDISDAFREAYRVTRTQGELQIGPVHEDVIPGYRELVSNDFPGATLKFLKGKEAGVVSVRKKV